MENKGTYLGTMIALASVAFGFLAAGAWNTFVADLFKAFFPPTTGIWGDLVYAVIATIIAIVVMSSLAKLAAREIGPRS
ncbi:MAG: DUF5654 family protein [Candidatus Eremiobacterales bacterium]